MGIQVYDLFRKSRRTIITEPIGIRIPNVLSAIIRLGSLKSKSLKVGLKIAANVGSIVHLNRDCHNYDWAQYVNSR